MLFRYVFIFCGAYLTVNSVTRIAFELWRWWVLARLELAPAVVDGRPHNVRIGLHCFMAALGVTMFMYGVLA